jgi:hypothetical protein
VEAENTAALAAARAAWNSTQVWPVGGVPSTPTTPYLVVSVTAGAPGNYRARFHGSKKHYIVVQAVGKTVGEVSRAVDKADAAFEDKALTISGFQCTETNGEERTASPVIRDPDGGVLLTCTVLYPFYAYPTS